MSTNMSTDPKLGPVELKQPIKHFKPFLKEDLVDPTLLTSHPATKLVVFDFDETITLKHYHSQFQKKGWSTKNNSSDIINCVREWLEKNVNEEIRCKELFQASMRAFLQSGGCLAIASYSLYEDAIQVVLGELFNDFPKELQARIIIASPAWIRISNGYKPPNDKIPQIERAMAYLGISDKRRVCFFDDSFDNCRAAMKEEYPSIQVFKNNDYDLRLLGKLSTEINFSSLFMQGVQVITPEYGCELMSYYEAQELTSYQKMQLALSLPLRGQGELPAILETSDSTSLDKVSGLELEHSASQHTADPESAGLFSRSVRVCA